MAYVLVMDYRRTAPTCMHVKHIHTVGELEREFLAHLACTFHGPSKENRKYNIEAEVQLLHTYVTHRYRDRVGMYIMYDETASHAGLDSNPILERVTAGRMMYRGTCWVFSIDMVEVSLRDIREASLHTGEAVPKWSVVKHCFGEYMASYFNTLQKVRTNLMECLQKYADMSETERGDRLLQYVVDYWSQWMNQHLGDDPNKVLSSHIISASPIRVAYCESSHEHLNTIMVVLPPFVDMLPMQDIFVQQNRSSVLFDDSSPIHFAWNEADEADMYTGAVKVHTLQGIDSHNIVFMNNSDIMLSTMSGGSRGSSSHCIKSTGLERLIAMVRGAVPLPIKVRIHRCSLCRAVAMYFCKCRFPYCSLTCQKEHWTTHKLDCAARKDRVAALNLVKAAARQNISKFDTREEMVAGMETEALRLIKYADDTTPHWSKQGWRMEHMPTALRLCRVTPSIGLINKEIMWVEEVTEVCSSRIDGAGFGLFATHDLSLNQMLVTRDTLWGPNFADTTFTSRCSRMMQGILTQHCLHNNAGGAIDLQGMTLFHIVSTLTTSDQVDELIGWHDMHMAPYSQGCKLADLTTQDQALVILAWKLKGARSHAWSLDNMERVMRLIKTFHFSLPIDVPLRILLTWYSMDWGNNVLQDIESLVPQCIDKSFQDPCTMMGFLHKHVSRINSCTDVKGTNVLWYYHPTLGHRVFLKATRSISKGEELMFPPDR